MDKKWYVIQTKPKNEKKVFLQICQKGIETFLPLIESIRYWSDRKKKLQVPLFPNYVFVYGNEEERVRAISETYGALRYVMFQKKPAVISEQEIQNIKISLKAPERVKIEHINISEGDLVEITDGLFKGLTGFITQIRGNYKVVVNIREIGASFSVQLNNSEVKLLQPVIKNETQYKHKKLWQIKT
jgi:transcription antitermination factor NusG